MRNTSYQKGFTQHHLRHTMKSGAGFTLLETLIYLFLFTIVIGGGMIAAYNIIEGTNAAYNHVILQEEANFLFRKISWALTGATAISTPSATSLSVTKTGSPDLLLDFSDPNIRLTQGLGSAVVLNSSSIKVSGVLFAIETGALDKVTTSFTLTTVQNGRPATQDFTFTKYLRQ